MGKSGIIKPVIMLAFLGIILTVLINPISGDPMNQGSMNMAGQENMTGSCPCGGMHMMHCHFMMGDHAGNETIMGDMMGGHSANETMMMPCMMGNNSTNGMMMHCMMMHCMMMHESAANESNKTMMPCHCMMGDHAGNMSMMMGNNSRNETMMMPCMMMGNNSTNGMMHCPCMTMNQNATMSQARIDCAAFWLKKAIEVHDLHLKDPEAAANESSQLEMMDQMMRAYACLTGENMTENMTHDMMTNTTLHASGAH